MAKGGSDGTGAGKDQAELDLSLPATGTAMQDPIAILQQAVQVASDPAIKLALQAALAQQAPQAPKVAVSTREAHRKAETAKRDANAKHDAAVKAVERAAVQLAQAQLREQEAVRILAQAELAKRTAVKALAAEEAGDLNFDVVWDESFSDSLRDGSLECEDAEKQELLQLEKDLVAAKSYIGEKGDTVREWHSRVGALEYKLSTRRAQEREGTDGAPQAADEPGAGEGAAMPPTAAAAPRAPDTERAAAEIRRGRVHPQRQGGSDAGSGGRRRPGLAGGP
ncbi:unnamed protein product [Prorocentrum cordatum]|uniref:Uncharacterized protein n=1 Tax=Prorocentrum cordatum TaxID=2364126 RepID=A0ABN9UDB3_9DINO|nr:unnamed protein product [Polarella glacialis]